MKHITFESMDVSHITTDLEDKTWMAWRVKDKQGRQLGVIEYAVCWKTFIFLPDDETIWSVDCLIEIVKFLEKINEVSA